MCNTVSSIIFVMVVAGCIGGQASAESKTTELQKIQGLYEPSGLVQLKDGRLLVVEDEPTSPFALLTQKPDTKSFSISSLQFNALLHPAMTKLSDLEAVAMHPDGSVYAITSQSRKSNGKRVREREKIMRVSIEKDRLLNSYVRKDFRKQLTRAFPALKNSAKTRDVKNLGGLNIEGLTFSPKGDILWIGLRAPLFDDRAILVAVLNPRDALDNRRAFQFAKDLVFLDLDRGGVRDIIYDPTLSGYLILSQRENTQKEKPFKLWLWNGNPNTSPVRVRIRGVRKLKRTEGIAAVRLQEKQLLMLVNDDGNRKQDKPASYLLVDYTHLNIDPVRE